jgi:hypothetical protein
LEKGHGRLEKREVRIVTGIDWLENSETLVFLRNVGGFADNRGHWSIENNLQGILT